MENPISMDDLGVQTIFGNTHIYFSLEHSHPSHLIPSRSLSTSLPLKSYQNPIGKACLPTTIFHGYIKLPGCKVSFSSLSHQTNLQLPKGGAENPANPSTPRPVTSLAFFLVFKSHETQRVQVLHDSTHAIVGIINLQGSSILRRILMIHSAFVVEVAASFLVGVSSQF